jgi:hypothetical protein
MTTAIDSDSDSHSISSEAARERETFKLVDMLLVHRLTFERLSISAVPFLITTSASNAMSDV